MYPFKEFKFVGNFSASAMEGVPGYLGMQFQHVPAFFWLTFYDRSCRGLCLNLWGVRSRGSTVIAMFHGGSTDPLTGYPFFCRPVPSAEDAMNLCPCTAARRLKAQGFAYRISVNMGLGQGSKMHNHATPISGHPVCGGLSKIYSEHL